MEGGASTAYHRAVENIKVRWAVRDRKLVPEHWLVIGPRQSKLMYTRVSARYATNPANAIRNLAFTVLANQVRVAAAVKGFDLGCGWLHSDDRHRDTLVYDVMEPYRPVVDEKVIGLVTNARFTYGDFVTTKEGQVRLHPALAKFVVATCVIPWIEIDLSPVERLLLDE
jgi:CRISPR-associated protein Cas1